MAMSPRKQMAMMKSGGAVKKMRGGGMMKKMKSGGPVKKMRGGGMVKKLRGGGMVKKMKMGGSAKTFPDLTGDGKVTKKDILVGKGVLKRNEGSPVDMDKELAKILKDVPPSKMPNVLDMFKRSKKSFLEDVPKQTKEAKKGFNRKPNMKGLPPAVKMPDMLKRSKKNK